MLEQLVETWQINHRMTIRLLEALSDDDLRATLSTRGGRDVGRQLAHVREVRAVHAEVTSNILLTLKQTGRKLADDLKWGLWEWNKI